MKVADPLPRSENEESFELLELLGRGGFAHTYRARVLDSELIEEYGTDEIALKIPLAGKQRALRKDFEINATLHVRLKPLRSANLVRYLGVEIFRGQLVMAMEYVRHGSLRRKLGPLDSQKRVEIPEAVEITEGVLSGLAVIHQEHIFHRDIKPENILMDDKIPKVADMGIARMLESNELASSTTGTLYYMSPEILGEAGADFRSDLWSVGVTLYEMVT
jgi:serine/threonine protein kinase